MRDSLHLSAIIWPFLLAISSGSAHSLQLNSTMIEQVPLPLPTPITEPQAQLPEFLQNLMSEKVPEDLIQPRIAYLTDGDDASYFSLVAQSLDVAVVKSWEQFESAALTEQYNVVLIEQDLKSSVNTDWLREVYRNGVIIAGVNLDFPEMREITGDNCGAKGFPSEHEANPDQDFLIIYFLKIEPMEGANLDAIYEAELNTCKEDPDSTGGYGMTRTIRIIRERTKASSEFVQATFSQLLNR